MYAYAYSPGGCKKKYLNDLIVREEDSLTELNAIGRDTALLHFYFRENPDKWDDDEYARNRARLYFALNLLKNTTLPR